MFLGAAVEVLGEEGSPSLAEPRLCGQCGSCGPAAGSPDGGHSPGGGHSPRGSQNRGTARTPSLLGAVRVALPRGPPAASIPEESWAEGGLGSPFSLPPSPPGLRSGTRRQRRAGLRDGGPGSRAAGGGRCRRRGSAESPAEPRAPPEPSWRGERLSAASPRQRPPRSCCCP